MQFVEPAVILLGAPIENVSIYLHLRLSRLQLMYVINNKNNKKLYYIDDDGEETEAVFDFVPSQEEIEGLLIFLNKDKIAQA